MSRTTDPNFPGWYLTFQMACLAQLPRPGEIDKIMAESWVHNQSGLSKVLAEALLPDTVNRGSKAETHRFLKPLASAVLPATEAFDPNELKRRSDIRLYDGMKWFILPVAGPIGPLPKGTLQCFGFRRALYDKEIIGELPESHILPASEFLARFAVLTALQSGGKSGLLSTTYFNVVYVRGVDGAVFVARVGWNFDRWGWTFEANRLDTYQWPDAYFALVATTGPLAS